MDCRLWRKTASLLAFLPALWLTPAVAQDSDTVDEPETQKSLVAELERQLAAPLPPDSDPQALCVALHQRGMAHIRLGRNADGIRDLRRALDLNQPAWLARGKWCDRWRIQSDLGRSYRQAGDPLARVAFVKQLGEEVRQSNLRRYFFTLTWLMDDYATLGLLRQAEESLRQAEDLVPQLRQRKDWATEEHSVLDQLSVYKAYLQELRGNFAEAERLRRDALLHARAYAELRARLETPDSQLLRAARGNVVSALRLLANTLSAQGKFAEAEIYAREGLTQLLGYTSRNSSDASRALANLANIKLQQGRLAEAERLSREALAAMEGTQVQAASPLLAERRAELGFLLQLRERWPESLALFEARDKGLRSNPTQFARIGSLRTDWAYALIRNGKAAEALDMMKRIVAHYERAPYADPQLVARSRGYLAIALAAQGQDDAALAVFAQVVPQLIESAGNDSEGDGLGFGKQFRIVNIHEAYLELLARRQAKGLKVDGRLPADEAFMIADAARGSAVQRAVLGSVARASLPDPALAGLAAREQELGQRRASLTKLLARLAGAADGRQPDGIVADMRRDIDRLGDEQKAVRRELAGRFPEYLNLIDPRPVRPADMQGVLKADEAALVVYLGRDQGYVWTLTPEKAGFRVLPRSRASIAGLVDKLRRDVDLESNLLRRFDSAAANELYRLVLAPDAALWEGRQLLDVIAHGPLGQIPFALLLTAPWPAGKPLQQAPWLGERMALAQQPSASSFLALRGQPANGAAREAFLGFGDPLFASAGVGNAAGAAAPGAVRSLRLRGGDGEPPGDMQAAFGRLAALPDTAQELNEIAGLLGVDPGRQLYLGRQASERNLKNLPLRQYRVLAFATHGLVPGELPGLDQPALALANPALTGDADNDGFLTLDEVIGLRLDADWVVLSACNTGSSDGLQAEAISGLGRGFFYAGARSLLVSNWAVESASARLLTTGIFRHQQGDGIGRAEALRRSARDLRLRDRGQYAHPAFWAPFTLVGDGLR